MLPTDPKDQSDFVPSRHLRIERGGLHISCEIPAVSAAESFNRAVREISASAKRDDTSKAYSCPSVAQLAVDSASPFARRIYLLLEHNLRGGGPVEFAL